MDSVKAWAISICMASLAGTVAHFLAPSGNVQRIFKVVLSVFFITVMVYPIVDISLDDVGGVLDGYTYHDSYADNAEQIADVLLEQSVSQIRLSVDDKMKSLGIDECEIEINTDITADDSIVISSIEVTVGEDYRSSVSEIRAELQKYTDCKIAVYVGGNRDG